MSMRKRKRMQMRRLRPNVMRATWSFAQLPVVKPAVMRTKWRFVQLPVVCL